MVLGKKLASIALGAVLFSSSAYALPSGNKFCIQNPTGNARIERTITAANSPSSAKRISSKWHGGSCEVQGQKFTLKTQSRTIETKLPNFSSPGESRMLIGLSCSYNKMWLLYPDRIESYGSPENIATLTQAATTIPLSKKAIDGFFFKTPGNEWSALVAFENGQSQRLIFTYDKGYSVSRSKNPPEKIKLTLANLAQNGEYSHVVFPEAGRYAIYFTDCSGTQMVFEDQMGEISTISCSGRSCILKNVKGIAVQALEIQSCLPGETKSGKNKAK